jgi:hypothetical protein
MRSCISLVVYCGIEIANGISVVDDKDSTIIGTNSATQLATSPPSGVCWMLVDRPPTVQVLNITSCTHR